MRASAKETVPAVALSYHIRFVEVRETVKHWVRCALDDNTQWGRNPVGCKT